MKWGFDVITLVVIIIKPIYLDGIDERNGWFVERLHFYRDEEDKNDFEYDNKNLTCINIIQAWVVYCTICEFRS